METYVANLDQVDRLHGSADHVMIQDIVIGVDKEGVLA